MIVVLMGVSGSGKTTIGELVAQRLGWRFIEGDDFHPPENVAKMAAGIPLLRYRLPEDSSGQGRQVRQIRCWSFSRRAKPEPRD